MKAEEPVFVYKATPSVANLRKLIMNHVEHENNIRVLQQLLVFVEQVRKEDSAEKKVHPKGLNRKITISKRIKALSAVPSTPEDGDYKDDMVAGITPTPKSQPFHL